MFDTMTFDYFSLFLVGAKNSPSIGQVPERSKGPRCKRGGRKPYGGSNPPLPIAFHPRYGTAHIKVYSRGDVRFAGVV